MHKLAQANPNLVLDILCARVAYERTGVQLYDSVIRKIEVNGQERYRRMLETLRKHRGEEKEHEEWLEAQIRRLGGNPHDKTAMARLEEEESQGVKSVILDGHTQISHLLHALLTAELADNAGWDLLVKLAGDAGDVEAKKEFAKRMAHEVEHLAFVREAMKREAEFEVLGMRTELPAKTGEAIASMVKKPFAMGTLIAGAVAAAAVTFFARSRRAT